MCFCDKTTDTLLSLYKKTKQRPYCFILKAAPGVILDGSCGLWAGPSLHCLPVPTGNASFTACGDSSKLCANSEGSQGLSR